MLCGAASVRCKPPSLHAGRHSCHCAHARCWCVSCLGVCLCWRCMWWMTVPCRGVLGLIVMSAHVCGNPSGEQWRTGACGCVCLERTRGDRRGTLTRCCWGGFQAVPGLERTLRRLVWGVCWSYRLSGCQTSSITASKCQGRETNWWNCRLAVCFCALYYLEKHDTHLIYPSLLQLTTSLFCIRMLQ